MGESFAIHHHTAETGCTVVTLDGRLDARRAKAVGETLRDAVNEGAMGVVVDLTGVPFIDSAGLAALVSALKTSRKAGRNLVLAGIQPQTHTVFTLTMLDKVFTIYSTLQAALDSLQPEPGHDEGGMRNL
jgi:anti-sigma B factor antagonist